ncbi:MAG TPA: hypothetical protein VNZ48_16180 [Xanthobacteraceae bacterium]|jgi:hypothetical protein|nr:hypothetical protein [Xanthobacteraceae bacterium]
MLSQFFQELSKLSPSALASVAALAGLVGVIISAVFGLVVAVIGKFLIGARDKQDKEVEWRTHAIELTKLDLERKLKTRSPTDTSPLRLSILDFLANYRDLQELGSKSPAELYKLIPEKRTTQTAAPAKEIPGVTTKEDNSQQT